MSYSIDLRERVIAYIEQGGRKLDAARLFDVGRPTIDRWLQLKKETGSLKDSPLEPRSWRKLCPEALTAYVNANPDAFLSDYAAHFNVSEAGIWYALERLKITRKKVPPLQRTR